MDSAIIETHYLRIGINANYATYFSRIQEYYAALAAAITWFDRGRFRAPARKGLIMPMNVFNGAKRCVPPSPGIFRILICMACRWIFNAMADEYFVAGRWVARSFFLDVRVAFASELCAMIV